MEPFNGPYSPGQCPLLPPLVHSNEPLNPHWTALHCDTLHCTTLHYTTLHYTTLHYTTLHYTAQQPPADARWAAEVWPPDGRSAAAAWHTALVCCVQLPGCAPTMLCSAAVCHEIQGAFFNSPPEFG